METVLKIFTNFKARRSALITALTTEAEELYQLCGDKMHNLCLYGYPNKQWRVAPPVEMVPPDLPEPISTFQEMKWKRGTGCLLLQSIAIHGYSLSLSIMAAYLVLGGLLFFFADRAALLGSYVTALIHYYLRQSDCRQIWKHLFALINELPTISEVVSATAKESETKSNTIGGLDEEGHTVCGACGGNDGQSEFWICCDVCEKWFHGKCMKIYPETVHILQYKCRACSSS